MYTKLEIAHFRAFSSLAVAPLNRLNVIAGDNNIGKTAILEAIYLAHADLAGLKALPVLFRKQQHNVFDDTRDLTDNFWLWLFHQHDLAGEWMISLQEGSATTREVRGRLVVGEGQNEKPYSREAPISEAVLRVSTSSNGNAQDAWYRLESGFASYRGSPSPSPTVVTAIGTRSEAPSVDAELVNTIAVRNEDEELVDYLRLVEPRLRKLKYLKLPNHKFAYVYADIGFGRGRDLIPATQLGQGFSRLLTLFATVMVNKTGILLVDEFENGLQHDALTPIWKSLDQFARTRRMQVFATTHSYECIQAAHKASLEAVDYDLALVKLQSNAAQGIEAVVLDRDMIDTAIDQHLEVR